MIKYISGPIESDPEYRKKFGETAKILKAQGHTVLNPAELPEGMSKADYMRINFAMIDTADAIVMLPGWGRSHGASLERLYALYVGKRIEILHEERTVVQQG